MTVEWLDGDADGGADELPQPPSIGPGKRRAIWIGALAIVVAIGVAVGVSQRSPGSKPVAVSSTSPSSSTPRPSSTTPTSLPTTSALTGPHPVTEVGHRILGATSNWELFAHGDGTLIRIELAAGRVQRTDVPGLSSGGGISFVVGPTSAILRPFDAVEGLVVQDGKAARVLRGLLAQGGTIFDGPTPDQVWVQAQTDGPTTPAPRLYDLRQDRPIATGPTPPQELGQPYLTDGAGYLLYSGVGGVYDVRPDGVHRVTTGAVAAVGRHSLVVQECDDSFRCDSVLIDRPSGRRTVLGPTHAAVTYLPGSISPDGRFAAYTTATNGNQATTRLVDLRSGRDTDLGVRVSDSAYGSDPFVWDPDNGDLLLVDNQSTIRVIDPTTDKVSSLGIDLPPINQIAIRPASD